MHDRIPRTDTSPPLNPDQTLQPTYLHFHEAQEHDSANFTQLLPGRRQSDGVSIVSEVVVDLSGRPDRDWTRRVRRSLVRSFVRSAAARRRTGSSRGPVPSLSRGLWRLNGGAETPRAPPRRAWISAVRPVSDHASRALADSKMCGSKIYLGLIIN